MAMKQENLTKVLQFLLAKAAAGETTTYREIYDSCGIKEDDNAFQIALTEYLTAIFYWCNERKLPRLTSIVVRKSGADQGLPGRGFWELLTQPAELKFVNIDQYATRKALTMIFHNQVFDFFRLKVE